MTRDRRSLEERTIAFYTSENVPLRESGREAATCCKGCSCDKLTPNTEAVRG
jgi:hypothetical protein